MTLTSCKCTMPRSPTTRQQPPAPEDQPFALLPWPLVVWFAFAMLLIAALIFIASEFVPASFVPALNR